MYMRMHTKQYIIIIYVRCRRCAHAAIANTNGSGVVSAAVSCTPFAFFFIFHFLLFIFRCRYKTDRRANLWASSYISSAVSRSTHNILYRAVRHNNTYVSTVSSAKSDLVRLYYYYYYFVLSISNFFFAIRRRAAITLNSHFFFLRNPLAVYGMHLTHTVPTFTWKKFISHARYCSNTTLRSRTAVNIVLYIFIWNTTEY